jgi:hypothetical protein
MLIWPENRPAAYPAYIKTGYWISGAGRKPDILKTFLKRLYLSIEAAAISSTERADLAQEYLLRQIRVK